MFRTAFLLLLPLAAAPAQEARLWKAADLKKSGARLSAKIDTNKFAGETLGDYGKYSTNLTHREGDGEAEIHAATTDIFIIQSGGGTVVTGGKIARSRTIGPGEIRGPSIEAGTKHEVVPGDILHIPAGTPHQVLVPPGREITYFVVKVTK